MTQRTKDFLDISDVEEKDLRHILEFAKKMKSDLKSGIINKILEGKQLAMIFEKESTRTRVSFEVGINQLGGNAIFISGSHSQIGRGEPIKDTANVLSRYVDIIMIRTYKHEGLLELAENASVPVINGLTDYSHPCQIMADILTIEEHLGDIKNQRIAWLGDYNNVCRSWIQAANKFGFELNISFPTKFKYENFESEFVKYYENPKDAVQNANVITTDTWVSMGENEDNIEKKRILKPYQVNEEIFALANKNAIFLHCLPAHRGEEVTSEIIDGEKSVIYDEAENRLHIQKSIMVWCCGLI